MLAVSCVAQAERLLPVLGRQALLARSPMGLPAIRWADYGRPESRSSLSRALLRESGPPRAGTADGQRPSRCRLDGKECAKDALRAGARLRRKEYGTGPPR